MTTSLPVQTGFGLRKSYARTPVAMSLPNLIEVQKKSFEWFLEDGLREILEEFPPILSYGKAYQLTLGKHTFEEPKFSEEECRNNDKTYAAPLKIDVSLLNMSTGEIVDQEVYLGDFPMMTRTGTFIMNGAERVVVSQLIRSPGVYFSQVADRSTGRPLATAKVIPSRGAWLEFETSKRDEITVKVDRKRKQSVTILIRALGYGTDEEIRALFKDVDTDEQHRFIEATLEKDPLAPVVNGEEGVKDAQIRFYRTQRPSDPAKAEAARRFIEEQFFDTRRYDLGKVGRYKLDQRLERTERMEQRILTPRGPPGHRAAHDPDQQPRGRYGRDGSPGQPPREHGRRVAAGPGPGGAGADWKRACATGWRCAIPNRWCRPS